MQLHGTNGIIRGMVTQSYRVYRTTISTPITRLHSLCASLVSSLSMRIFGIRVTYEEVWFVLICKPHEVFKLIQNTFLYTLDTLISNFCKRNLLTLCICWVFLVTKMSNSRRRGIFQPISLVLTYKPMGFDNCCHFPCWALPANLCTLVRTLTDIPGFVEKLTILECTSLPVKVRVAKILQMYIIHV